MMMMMMLNSSNYIFSLIKKKETVLISDSLCTGNVYDLYGIDTSLYRAR